MINQEECHSGYIAGGILRQGGEMRVRIIKEMPWRNGLIGDIKRLTFNNDATESFKQGVVLSRDCIKNMIAYGWLEEIKESLEDEINSSVLIGDTFEVAQIAKDHCLEVFDKAMRLNGDPTFIKELRKAIEEWNRVFI